MEKPLFNFRSKRNYLRYHYFYGKAYLFLQSFEFAILGIIMIFVVDALLDHQRILKIPLMLLIIDLGGCALTLLIAKLILNPPLKMWLLVALGNTVFIHCAIYGGFFIADIRGFTLGVSIVMYILTTSKVGRINLFPDRMVIYCGWKRLYTLSYDKVQSIQWSVEPVDKHFPSESQKTPIKMLTPIEYETHGEDFTIYHYYVYIATDYQALILQPVSYRSQFAQNAYNGWIEDFRWTGENVKLKMPPSSWESKPHPKPYS